MILLSHERIIFVSPTLKNLSCCQVPDKNGRVKSSAVQNRAKKAEKKQAAVEKKNVDRESWRTAAGNAIPCVEIVQHKRKMPKKSCLRVSQIV